MDPKNIRVIHTTHPLSQESFRMMATPPEVIEANKSKSQFRCTACSTTRNKLPTCQRVSMTFYFSLKNLQSYGLQCKSVWYCSKECQKTDWYVNRSVFSSESSPLFRPRHKTWCTVSDRPKGVQELVKTLASNVTLITMLQVCAALDLDLNRNRELGFKVPFMSRVDIAIEPSNVHSFVKLFLTDEPYGEKMEGMIQINHFYSLIPGKSGNAPLTKMRDNMWRVEREKLNRNGRRNDALGLLEFVNNSDFSITIPFPVNSPSMKVAKEKEPFLMLSGLTGTTVEKPMTVASCME